MKKSLCYLLLIAAATLHGCSGQPSQRFDCAIHLKNAGQIYTSYFQNKKRSTLLEALNEIDFALACPDTKRAAVIMKISLLSLLKRYQQGADFVDSLSTADFKMTYQKDMYSRFFEAMSFDSAGDTARRNEYFHEGACKISNYIKNERLSKDSINEEAIYDLCFVESRYLHKPQLERQIDSFARLYPNDTDFLVGLKSSFYDTSSHWLPLLAH